MARIVHSFTSGSIVASNIIDLYVFTLKQSKSVCIKKIMLKVPLRRPVEEQNYVY